MRAQEFIVENRPASITKRQRWGTRGLHKFRDADGRDRFYELNRVMMAVAAADGVNPIDVPSASWTHNSNTSHPYTAEEDAMLKQAYKAMGSRYQDLNRGDMRSQEPPGGNTASPIKSFQGYAK